MERAAISMIEANVTRSGWHHAWLGGQMRAEADADLAICGELVAGATCTPVRIHT
jgi:hypothetical protein